MADSKRFSHQALVKLSSLSAAQLDDFTRAWPDVPLAERRRVVRALVDMAQDNVELDYNDLFLRMLSDADPEVRSAAVEGLWEDERASTVDALIALLSRDADERVRAAALDGIGRFAYRLALDELPPRVGDRVRAALFALLDPPTPVPIRRRALEAAAYLNDDAVRAAIRAAYASDDPALRASAVSAMGRTCDEMWLDTILRELTGDVAAIRFEAARAAGEMEDERAVPALIEALGDEDDEVRLAAVEALGAIGGQRARQALLRVRGGRDEAMRLVAETALEELDALADPLGIRPRDVNPN